MARDLRAEDPPLRPRVRESRPTGRSSTWSSSPSGPCSTGSSRCAATRTARSRSAAHARRRSAARAACKINGRSRLACNTQLGEAAERAKDGAIVVEPMGNMPVLKDLIVDMDAVHWKKVQRVVPVAPPRRPAARARVHRPGGVDDRHHAGDGLHPLRRLRVGLPVARGGPGVHRAGRARQGVPLRRRPARRPGGAAAEGPGRGSARHLRLHALLPVRRGVPEGRRPDGPDHAPAPHARRATSRSRTRTTATATRRRS